jgi:NhaP-type Na+/H+ or K+/H+ antiporter
MDIVYLLIGIAIGFALAWFIKKSQQQGSSAPAEELNTSNKKTKA